MTGEETYARGGYVGGGEVALPPLLDNGFVISRAQVEALGTDFLDRLNRAEEEDVDEP